MRQIAAFDPGALALGTATNQVGQSSKSEGYSFQDTFTKAKEENIKPVEPKPERKAMAVETKTTEEDSTKLEKTREKELVENDNKPEENIEKKDLNENSKPDDIKVTDQEAAKPEKIDEETLEQIQEAFAEIMMILEQNIGVDSGKLQEAMEELGISLEDLMTDEAGLKPMVLELLDVDNIEMVTDEKLFSKVSNITKELENILAELEEDTGLEREDIKGIAEMLLNQDTKNTTKALLDVEQTDNEYTFEINESVKQDKVIVDVEDLDMDKVQPDMMTQTSEIKEDKPKNNGIKNETTEDENKLDFEKDMTKEAETIENNTSKTDEKSNQNNHKEGGSEKRDFSENLATQKFTINQEEVLTEQIGRESFTTDTMLDTKRLIDELADNVKVMQQDEQTTMEMQLHPQSLGTVRIALTTKGGSITAQFSAQNESVKQALEAQVSQLKTSLEEQGVKVEAIEISVNSHGLEKNLDEKGENRNEQKNKEQDEKITKARRRSINLNSWAKGEIDEEEELDEDTLLTREMMELYGNSMDLLA